LTPSCARETQTAGEFADYATKRNGRVLTENRYLHTATTH
jgi:hypothetical protein